MGWPNRLHQYKHVLQRTNAIIVGKHARCGSVLSPAAQWGARFTSAIELTARVRIKERQIDGGVLLPFKDRHARVRKFSPAAVWILML